MFPGFLNLMKRKFKNKGNSYKILFGSLFATLLFAILYYSNDLFCRSNFELAKKNNLIEKSINNKESLPKTDFIYYIWFSLITQTTVGYSNLLPKQDNTDKIHLQVFVLNKYINMIQLFTIFGIVAFL
tara:strand:+ start:120 stop:503 length:384 start_codon:yes stop_codon:yes gene_type:complete